MKKKRIVSDSLRKSFPLLKMTANMKRDNRQRILKEIGGDETVYNALHEIAYNTIKGNYKHPITHSKKLKRYKPLLQEFCVSKNKTCSRKRKQLIEQSGGFLPILIPALATIISSIISRV